MKQNIEQPGVRIFARLMNLVRPHWWRLAVAMVCMSGVAATTSAVAYLIKPLLDEVFIAQDMNKLKSVPGLVLGAVPGQGIL